MSWHRWRLALLVASMAAPLGCGRTHTPAGDVEVFDPPADDSGPVEPATPDPATPGASPDGDPAPAGAGSGATAPGIPVAGAPAGPGAPGSASTSPDAPSSVSDLPEPAEGITTVDGAELPLGLWVGQLYFPASWLPELDAICGTDSNRVTLQIEKADVDAWAFGVIVFGDEQIIGPQPTHPEEGYPPGYEGLLCGVEGLSAGYPYAVRDGRVSESGELRFRVAWAELWDSWCSMQPSYDYDAVGGYGIGGYGCAPALTMDEIEQIPDGCGDRNYPGRDELDCPFPIHVAELCGPRGACICFADGCRAKLSRTVHFELQLDGEEMAGLLTVDEVFPAVEVRLRRVR